MNDEELARAYRASAQLPPQGFAARSDYQLARLTAKEEIMKKKVSFAAVLVAVMTVLCMTAAIAAGAFRTTQPKDDLGIGSGMEETLHASGMLEEPQLAQTVNGVTISLDTSVVDGNSAYLAFRIKGLNKEHWNDPAFDRTEITWDGIENTGYCANGQFLLEWTEDGEEFVDENGDLVCVISLLATDDTLIGKNIHVALTDLGEINKEHTVDVAVSGTWEFDYELKGTQEQPLQKELSQKIPGKDVILQSVRLSPLYMELAYRNCIPEEADDFGAPCFCGFLLKDGTVVHEEGCLAATQKYDDRTVDEIMLLKVIRPEDVAGLLFFSGAEGQYVEVMLD